MCVFHQILPLWDRIFRIFKALKCNCILGIKIFNSVTPRNIFKTWTKLISVDSHRIQTVDKKNLKK